RVVTISVEGVSDPAVQDRSEVRHLLHRVVADALEQRVLRTGDLRGGAADGFRVDPQIAAAGHQVRGCGDLRQPVEDVVGAPADEVGVRDVRILAAVHAGDELAARLWDRAADHGARAPVRPVGAGGGGAGVALAPDRGGADLTARARSPMRMPMSREIFTPIEQPTTTGRSTSSASSTRMQNRA